MIKKCLLLSLLFLVTYSIHAQRGYVDLGLPSGTLWKYQNEDGYWTYEEASNFFAGQLPSEGQYKELRDYCEWSWMGNACKVTGPNGNFIVLQAMGYRGNGTVRDYGDKGFYWTSTPTSSTGAKCFKFDEDGYGPRSQMRSLEMPVRLVSRR